MSTSRADRAAPPAAGAAAAAPAPPSRDPRLSTKGKERLLAVATPLALLVVWEVLVLAGLLDARFFPAPSSILTRMVELMLNGELVGHTLTSLRRLFLGFWLGLVPGLLLGVAMGLIRPLRAAVKPLVSGTYPIPKSALLPLILLIFGLGEMSKIVMVAIGVFYPVVLNTLAGVTQIAPIYYDVAGNFQAGRLQVFRTVALPGAMPTIMTGVELGAGLGLILIAIAEMVGAQSGLGFMIWNAWQLYSVETMYVGLLVIAVIGYVLSLLLAELGRVLIPWNVER